MALCIKSPVTPPFLYCDVIVDHATSRDCIRSPTIRLTHNVQSISATPAVCVHETNIDRYKIGVNIDVYSPGANLP